MTTKKLGLKAVSGYNPFIDCMSAVLSCICCVRLLEGGVRLFLIHIQNKTAMCSDGKAVKTAISWLQLSGDETFSLNQTQHQSSCQSCESISIDAEDGGGDNRVRAAVHDPNVHWKCFGPAADGFRGKSEQRIWGAPRAGKGLYLFQSQTVQWPKMTFPGRSVRKENKRKYGTVPTATHNGKWFSHPRLMSLFPRDIVRVIPPHTFCEYFPGPLH